MTVEEIMKPAPFEYHSPNTLQEALSLLHERGDEAKFIAGTRLCDEFPRGAALDAD